MKPILQLLLALCLPCSAAIAQPPSAAPQRHTVHLHDRPSKLLQQTFALYGIDIVLLAPPVHDSIPLQLDLGDADLLTASRALTDLTRCFFVPAGAHLILALPDDPLQRQRFQPPTTHTLNIANLPASDPAALKVEQKSVQELLNTVFGVTRSAFHGSQLTYKATPTTSFEIEQALGRIYRPSAQVSLKIRTYRVVRTLTRDTGLEPPHTITIFNVDSAIDSLLADPTASTLLEASSLYFGGGLTETAVQFDSLALELDLANAVTQQLQEATLELADGQPGLLRYGQKYPVLTATTEAVSTSSSTTSTPTIQYMDLGLTLEAKPHILADGEVQLHLHEALASLGGSTLNSIPILDSTEFTTDFSLHNGATTVIVSNLTHDSQPSRQGIFALPTETAQNLTDSELLVEITPTITRRAEP